MFRRIGLVFALTVCIGGALAAPSRAALTYFVDPGSPWPAGRYDAAVANMQTVVNMHNAYGDFGNGNIYVYYNAGIPTAQANYNGSIGVGGTYPGVRVLLHESAHWLGTGTYSANWRGPNTTTLMQQFEGAGAYLSGDDAHFWPYGENFDNESSPLNDARHVAVVYALRRDFGVGSNALPSAATNVTMTASDALGTSGFNQPWNWSDGHFPQANTNYFTGNNLLRTPLDTNNPGAATPSFKFAGDSLTVNNTNGVNGGLLFKGVGQASVLNFKNLVVDGGYVRHASGGADLFQLAGRVTLNNTATFDTAQGNINVLANVGGTGSLNKVGPYTLNLANLNNYGGNTNIAGGVLRLAATGPVASYTFDNVNGGTVVNGGTGGNAMNGTLAGGAAVVAGGQSGNAVSLAGGASVNINNPIADLGNNGNWTVSAWVKTATPGGSIFTKGDGAGWVSGNSIFYLGDGTAGGSGGVPSAVRWGGGFYQAAAGGTSVTNNAWHQVTYVNLQGQTAIYVDGVAQSLSAGNAGFAVPDVGAVVRLGVSTNTFAGDGTVNFNGLLDNVQFYNQALTSQQVASLYQGNNLFGTLPATTNVTIASGAVLDLNNTMQQIASLAGPSGSSVALGSGQLTVNTTTTTQFAGGISGAGGTIIKQGFGKLTLAGTNTYSGMTTVSGGALGVDGSLAGAVTVNDSGSLQGIGSVAGLVTANIGGVIAPGNSAGTLTVGSLALGAGSQTQIELGGNTRGTQYDVLNVSGNADLNGTLRVTLAGGFLPSLGDQFDVLDWSTRGGTFSTLALQALANGLSWNTSQLYSQGALIVVSGLAGDYNNNGTVDAADYTLWRNNLGAAAGTLLNDTAGGAVGQTQYDTWKGNYGASIPGAGTAAVPEPTTATILVTLVSLLFIGRRGCR